MTAVQIGTAVIHAGFDEPMEWLGESPHYTVEMVARAGHGRGLRAPVDTVAL